MANKTEKHHCDISGFLSKEVAEKYEFSTDIPGPIFRSKNADGTTQFEFNAKSLTLEKCKELEKKGFPYIKAKATKAKDVKKAEEV